MPRAEKDFTEILDYISADNMLAAQKMASRVEHSLELSGLNPRLGRIARNEHVAKKGYRTVFVNSYIVFYKIKAHTVYVHRILHSARDYARLL
jgi:plasmid stabilization system protein ParE